MLFLFVFRLLGFHASSFFCYPRNSTSRDYCWRKLPYENPHDRRSRFAQRTIEMRRNKRHSSLNMSHLFLSFFAVKVKMDIDWPIWLFDMASFVSGSKVFVPPRTSSRTLIIRWIERRIDRNLSWASLGFDIKLAGRATGCLSIIVLIAIILSRDMLDRCPTKKRIVKLSWASVCLAASQGGV